MATKFYLHATTSGTPSGTLPTDEQSSLTPDANDFEGSRTTNRLMNTTVGVSQANLTNTSTGDTNPHNYYVSRWVSPLIYQARVSAQTWTLEFGAKEANAAANWPVSSTSQPLRINCYVWKPSDGTKVGTILDGNSNSDFEEAGTTQSVINGTFAGAEVTGISPGDACIVYEMWAVVTQANGTARVQDVYYDGTTENSTTSEAAFLSTPENLQFLADQTSDNSTVIASGGSFKASTANTTQYWVIAGDVECSSTEADYQIPIRVAGTLKHFQVRLQANSVSGNTTFTVRKNAADTSMTVTFGASATGIQEDLTNTASVSAGDKICVKSIPGAATNTFSVSTISMEFVPTTETDTVQILGTTKASNFSSASTTNYLITNGRSGVNSTEANMKTRQRVAGIYSKFFVYVTANARTTNTIFKSRKNGADGNLTVTYGSGETGLKEDTTNSDTVASGDDYGYAITTSTGTETITFSVIGVHFTNTTFHGILSTGNGPSAFNANQTNYTAAGGQPGVTGTQSNVNRRIRMTRMIAKDLHVYVTGNGVTADSTCTLMVNSTASALTVTITASTTGLFSDTTHTVNVGSNDDIALRMVGGATGTTFSISSATVYYTSGHISLASILKYHLLGRISLSRIYKYHVNARVTLSRIYKYNILGRVTLSRIYKYHLQARVSLSRILKYHVVGRISQSRIYKYNIQARISLSRIYKYHVASIVSLARTYKYNIIGRVSLSRIYKYHVIGRISLAKIYKYHIQGRVSQARTYKYNIQARVSLARTYLWNVLVEEGLERISKSQIYLWNVVGRISLSGIYKYNINQRISLSRTYLYNVLGRVSLARVYKYNLLGRISLSRIYKYNMLSRVTLSRIYKYNILSMVSLSRIYKYHIQSRTSLLRTYKYHIVGRISLSRIYKHNVTNRVSLSRVYLWNITNRVSKAVIFKWNVLARVTLERIYRWDFGRLTTTRDRAITGSTEGKQRFPKQFSQVKSFFYNPPETRAKRNSKYRRG